MRYGTTKNEFVDKETLSTFIPTRLAITKKSITIVSNHMEEV